jgi:hypothetical protein
MSPSLRRWIAALATGLVGEGSVLAAIYVLGGASGFLLLLVLAEACALGFLFGVRRGAVAAVVPFAVFAAFASSRDAGLLPQLTAFLFVCLLLASLAAACGAMRQRYLRR